MATAGIYNMSMDQGATFARQFTWKNKLKNPVDLTGYTARMQIRPTKMSEDIILSLTTENGRIVLGDDEGTINLSVSASITASLTPDKYFYDIELVSPGGVVVRLLKGSIKVNAEVTK